MASAQYSLTRPLFAKSFKDEALPTLQPADKGKASDSSMFVEAVCITLMSVLGLVNTVSASSIIFAGSAQPLLPRGIMMLLYSSALGPLVATLTQRGKPRVLIVTPDTLVVPFMAKLTADVASATDPQQYDVFESVAISMVRRTRSSGCTW